MVRVSPPTADTIDRRPSIIFASEITIVASAVVAASRICRIDVDAYIAKTHPGTNDMRSINDWFDSYGADHQNATNRLIHWICVPAILWSAIAALWVVPVPASIGKPGLWCALIMVGALGFYWRLSRPLGAAMIALFIALALLTHVLYDAVGPSGTLTIAAVVFVLAWVGQFVGHKIEGRRPSFLTDLAYLLIGPAWLMGKVLRRAGVAC
jgi:uncharacterized membrane protein YGL010W